MPNRKRKTRPGSGSRSAASTSKHGGRPRSEILRHVLKGLLVMAVVLGAKIALEHTSAGKELESAGYVLLQRHLSSDDVPIQVVDISNLEVSEITTPEGTYRATPRKALEDIIEALADQQPKAIGIDLDFSPDQKGFLTPDDPKFFEFCLNQGVPIFLGIHRTQLLSPERWLVDSRYEKLGANIIIPNNPIKMPASIQTSSSFKPGPTMGAALGSVLGGSGCRIGESFQRAGLATRESTFALESGGGIVEFLVDYGPLDSIRDKSLRTGNPELIPAMIRDRGSEFRNKIVIIGHGTLGKAMDTSRVAGQGESIPGVYIHACAAYTLGKAPLYELNWRGRLAIDALMAGSILLAVTGIRLSLRKKSDSAISIGKLQTVLTTIVVISAIVLGVVFVKITCVMWSDFIMALGAIVLHPSIERRMTSFWNSLKKIFPSIIRALFVETKRGRK